MVAASNGNVRIVVGSWEIEVCVHAQYDFGQKQPRTTGATSGGLKLQVAITTFSSLCCRSPVDFSIQLIFLLNVFCMQLNCTEQIINYQHHTVKADLFILPHLHNFRFRGSFCRYCKCTITLQAVLSRLCKNTICINRNSRYSTSRTENRLYYTPVVITALKKYGVCEERCLLLC